MATVFGKEGNDFYAAFYEPDAVKRRAALLAWADSAIPAIQAAVNEELKAFIDWVTEGRWTEAGWKEGEAKLHRIQPDYPLVMDIKLRKVGSKEKYMGALPEPVTYTPPPAVVDPVIQSSAQHGTPGNSSWDDDDDDGGDDGGRSSNDDRSDSMNPNNDAYWSSRGG